MNRLRVEFAPKKLKKTQRERGRIPATASKDETKDPFFPCFVPLIGEQMGEMELVVTRGSVDLSDYGIAPMSLALVIVFRFPRFSIT
jgi:hypothetical protein